MYSASDTYLKYLYNIILLTNNPKAVRHSAHRNFTVYDNTT